MLEREDAIAGMPIQSRQQQAERGGGIGNERDVRGRAVDEPGKLRAQAIGVVIPREKVRTGQFVPVCEVPGGRFGRTPR